MLFRRIARTWLAAASAAVVALACDGGGTTGPDSSSRAVLRLSLAEAKLEVGQEVRIQTASGQAADWRSSDSRVATVSPAGVVTGVAPGRATIIASRQGMSGTAEVTVVPRGASLAFKDGFEDGGLGRPQDGYGWRSGNAGPEDKVSVSADRARTGSHSLKFLYGGNADPCDDAWAEQRFTLGDNLPEVWLEYYVYLPEGTAEGGPGFRHRAPVCPAKNDPGGVNSNNKFFALWDQDYNKKHVKVLFEYRRTDRGADGDSRLYGMWCSDTRSCSNWNWAKGRWDPAFTDAVRGRWAQIRIHARVAGSKEAADGVLRLWVDGELQIDMQGLDLAPAEGGNRWFRNGYLMGWANSGFDQATAVYVDDFSIFRHDPQW